MKLRLLITEKCDRSCEGCCNQYWDLKTLPVVKLDEFSQYDELLMTGGEPMLNPKICMSLPNIVRHINPDIKVYMYTAKTEPLINLIKVLDNLDGICITIHDESDIDPFIKFQDWLMENDGYVGKSMRLNIFKKGLMSTQYLEKIWKIKDKKWKTHKHLSKNEVFMRLT